jgi:hypothetical protein
MLKRIFVTGGIMFALFGCDSEPAGVSVAMGGRGGPIVPIPDAPPVPGVPDGVFTVNCEQACNEQDTICGTVSDGGGNTCCCIGGCPWWAAECGEGVANGEIGPGESPVGDGVFTSACENACNAAATTCGTATNAQGETCCCVGSCPQLAQDCAASVENGQEFPPKPNPGPKGLNMEALDLAP